MRVRRSRGVGLVHSRGLRVGAVFGGSSHGRTLRYGIQLHTSAGDISEAAWAEAGRLLDQIDQPEIDRIQAKLRSDSRIRTIRTVMTSNRVEAGASARARSSVPVRRVSSAARC